MVEVDGGLHSTDAAIQHDSRRDRFVEAQGYQVLRVTTVDVLARLDGVVQTIIGMAGIG